MELEFLAWLALPPEERWAAAQCEPALRQPPELTGLVAQARANLGIPGSEPGELARLAISLLTHPETRALGSYRADLLATAWSVLTETQLRQGDLDGAELSLAQAEAAAERGSGDPLVLQDCLIGAILLEASMGKWAQVAQALRRLPHLPRSIEDPLAEAEALLWVATLQDPERPASRSARARAEQLVPDLTFRMLSQETQTRALALRLSPPSTAQSTTVH
jgi:hypothetical protein